MILQIFLILLIGQSQVDGFFLSFSDIKSILGFVRNAYNNVREASDAYDFLLGGDETSVDDVLKAVSNLTNVVNEMGTKIEAKIDSAVRKLITQLPLAHKIDSRFQNFWECVMRINMFYESLEDYTYDSGVMNDYSLKKYVKKVISTDSDAIEGLVEKLHLIIVPLGDFKDSLLALLATNIQETIDEMCDMDKSPQERLYDIYVIAMTSEIKAYAVMEFAYSMMSALKKSQNFMGELCKYERDLEKRIRGYGMVARETLQMAPRTTRRCDAPVHKRNQSYHEFERYHQKYLAIEQALNPDDSCAGTCTSVSNPSKVYPGCKGYQCYGTDTSCFGSIRYCDYFYSDFRKPAKICELPAGNSRRYLWYQDNDGNNFGAYDAACPGGKNMDIHAAVRPFARCDLCLCSCTEDSVKSLSSHFISMKEQLADTKNNRVVIGLKFVMLKKILHLQIREGKLNGEGTIDRDTVSWKPVNNIVYDRDASISKDAYVFYEKNDNEKTPLQRNVDVAVLTWDESVIGLDRLEISSENVVTGIRFKYTTSNQDPEKLLRLELRATPFNYTSGELTDPDNKSVWINADDMKKNKEKFKWYRGKREEFKMEGDLKNPLVKGMTSKRSKPNTYIKPGHSAIKQDGGQTVLPLIDAFRITSSPAVPLAGVNLFFKSQENYGGFLSLELITMDRAAHINIPEDDGIDRRESCRQKVQEHVAQENEENKHPKDKKKKGKKNKKNKKDKKH